MGAEQGEHITGHGHVGIPGAGHGEYFPGQVLVLDRLPGLPVQEVRGAETRLQNGVHGWRRGTAYSRMRRKSASVLLRCTMKRAAWAPSMTRWS